MPRIQEITTKAALPEEKHAIFDAIAESRGTVRLPFSLLLHSPEVAGRMAHLGTYLRFESVLPPAERELAIITVAREYDCECEWASHSRLARQAGVREEAIEIVAHRQPLDHLTPEEALVVAYGRELIGSHRVCDATFEAARARYGDRGITELTATVGYYSMIACVLNAFGAEAPAGAPGLP